MTSPEKGTYFGILPGIAWTESVPAIVDRRWSPLVAYRDGSRFVRFPRRQFVSLASLDPSPKLQPFQPNPA